MKNDNLLALPLPQDQESISQTSHPQWGDTQTYTVALPKDQGRARELAEQRLVDSKEVDRLSKPLLALVRTSSQRNKITRQTEGRLNRREVVRAYTGREDVFYKWEESGSGFSCFDGEIKMPTEKFIEVRIKGSGMHPGSIKSKDLAEIIVAIEGMIASFVIQENSTLKPTAHAN
jgi:hypothetical protein